MPHRADDAGLEDGKFAGFADAGCEAATNWIEGNVSAVKTRSR
jgi:hypothetical protein